MRSRDGSSSFLLTICTIVFFIYSNLYAKEYYISYRYVVKDAVLYNETFLLSKAMKKCIGKPKDEVLIFNKKHKSLKELLSDSSGEFIEYVHKLGLEVQNRTLQNSMQNSSLTVLTLKTTCFDIDYNKDFVVIRSIK